MVLISLLTSVAVWWTGIVTFRQLSPCTGIDVGDGLGSVVVFNTVAVVLPLIVSVIRTSLPLSLGARMLFCASPILVAFLYLVVLVVSVSFASTPPAIDLRAPAALAVMSVLPSISLAGASVAAVNSRLTPGRTAVSVVLVAVLASLVGLFLLVFAYLPNCS